MTSDNADLERRVLAHEEILQALIAHMVETEPRFLERLSATFRQPVHLEGDRQDDMATAAYAARFVREVIRLEEPKLVESQKPSLVALWDDLWPTSGEVGLKNENVPVRFELRQRDDMWEVIRNGRLVGGYVSHTGALEAAQQAILAVFTVGGSAELLTTDTTI
ncbi:hypothetical protein [Asticcacaulis biprosthecium]|nr:hypothetical protein [Asticcacaulis biprosthecium]